MFSEAMATLPFSFWMGALFRPGDPSLWMRQGSVTRTSKNHNFLTLWILVLIPIEIQETVAHFHRIHPWSWPMHIFVLTRRFDKPKLVSTIDLTFCNPIKVDIYSNIYLYYMIYVFLRMCFLYNISFLNHGETRKCQPSTLETIFSSNPCHMALQIFQVGVSLKNTFSTVIVKLHAGSISNDTLAREVVGRRPY